MSREDIFDKLETLVLDEEKVVTSKVLSREFKIHVNVARQYLLDFVTTQKTKDDLSLETSYVLAGFLENDGVKSLKVLVVTQDSLEKAKTTFSEVTSCHIYSVSKGKQNEVEIYNTDLPYNLRSHENRELLVIKHPKIETKVPSFSKKNVKKVDIKPSIMPQQSSVTKNGVSNLQVNSKEQLLKNKPKPDQVENQKSDSTVDTTQIKKSNTEVKEKVQKPNALASLWQKSEAKVIKNDTSKPEGKGKSKSPPESKKAPPKNNIMSMFSKQAEKNAGSSVTKTKVSDPIPVKKAEIVSPPKEVESTKSSKSEKVVPDKKSSNSSNKKRKSSQKQTKRSGKHNSGSDSDECKPMKKKHRRIAVFDDSDSNSECEDMEAEDKAQRSLWLPEDPIESPMVPPTPETDDGEDPIPPTPPVVSHKGRKKISKTVKKTFMDDEGFMVTTEEKEIVSESGSDEERISSKSVTSKDAPKANQFTYRKQASLTNFFKRS